MEALPTAPISGSRQLCDLFSLSSRFSPVTYRLRDNSPTLSPSVAKQAAIAAGISLLPAPSPAPLLPSTPSPVVLSLGLHLSSVPPPTTGGVSGQGSTAVPAHRPQPNRCPPAPGAILATAAALFCAVT